jgi:hypothetical protein
MAAAPLFNIAHGCLTGERYAREGQRRTTPHHDFTGLRERKVSSKVLQTLRRLARFFMSYLYSWLLI